MQLTLSVLLSVIAALVSLAVAAFAWQYRETEGVLELVVFNASIFVWTAGNAAQHFAVTKGAKLFWINVQYVGIVVVPLAVYMFACQFTGFQRWARGWRLGAVAAPLALLLFLTWTNEFHHLVRTENVRVVTESGIIVESFQEIDRSGAWGPAFWLGWLYSQVVVIVSTALLLRGVLYAQDVFQRQTVAVVVGAVVPWTGQFLYLAGVSPFEAEVFFVVSGGAFVYAVLRHEMLDLLPVARDAVLEMMDDGVVVVDLQGRVVDLNDAATEILGVDSGAVVGTDASDALADHPQLQECYERTESREDVAIELGGQERHYDVQVSSFRGDPGTGESGTVIVLHDITTLREREAELQRQNEQLEVVADTLSHDLRNPINVAAGFLEQARITGEEEPLDRVEKAHSRMEDIIEDVLTLARHDENIDPTTVDLGGVTREAWQHVHTGQGTLEVRGTATIEADRGQLLTLCENLFRNAVEHGGENVTVTVGVLDDGFYVEDDGPGIPENRRESIFDHGFTTNDEGTGFGLAIVSRVVEAHGWEIAAVEGTEGGARFEVTGVERTASEPETTARAGG